ncbi:valine N-monooxygenase 1-like protein [Tanacetum coccineum]
MEVWVSCEGYSCRLRRWIPPWAVAAVLTQKEVMWPPWRPRQARYLYRIAICRLPEPVNFSYARNVVHRDIDKIFHHDVHHFLSRVNVVVLARSKSTSFKLRQRQLPPWPKPLPYIGSLIPMLRNKPMFRWIHRLMDEMSTKIICVRLGSIHVIAVSDPKIAREFLKDKDEIFSSRPDSMSVNLACGGYLTTVLIPMSDYWKKMRKTLSRDILSVARHNWLQTKRNEEADNLIRYIPQRMICQCWDVHKGVVNVFRTIVQQYSSNVIRKIMFGSRYFSKGNGNGGPGAEEIEHVDSLLTILNYLYAFSVTDYFPWLRWINAILMVNEKIMRECYSYCTESKQDFVWLVKGFTME